MTMQFTFTTNNWIAEMVERTRTGTKSERIEELIIKGMMHEHDEKLKKQLEQAKKNMKVHA